MIRLQKLSYDFVSFIAHSSEDQVMNILYSRQDYENNQNKYVSSESNQNDVLSEQVILQWHLQRTDIDKWILNTN